MTKLLFLILFTVLFVSGAVALVSCTCSDCPKDDEPDIPEQISRAGDQLIMSKTGKEFFEQYITPDLAESKIIPQGFFLSYRLYIPERPYVDAKITFALDSNGVSSADIPVTGIPDCAASPDNCSFLVDENEARNIAEKAGLQKGMKEWGSAFLWNAEYNRYVWHIISTLKGIDSPEGFRGSGIEIMIDPNSGEILRQNEWNIR